MNNEYSVGLISITWQVLKTRFQIALKRVDLVNCDMPMDGLVVPF